MEHKGYLHLSKLAVIFCAILACLVVIPSASQAAPDTSLNAIIQHAWELARQSGRYNFTTRLTQTTHPAPSLANVGSGPRVETIYLEGQSDLDEDRLSMRLWQNGGRISDPSQAAEVLVEDGKTYGRQGGGNWQEIDNFTDSLAPGQDASAFLWAARNVELASSALQEDHYRFDISGPALAEKLRAQLEEQLRRAGELPSGMYLDAPAVFRDAIGSGEAWLDSTGYPARLNVHLEFPQQANGERIEIEVQTDFSNFDRLQVASLQSPTARLHAAAFGLASKARKPENLIAVSLFGLFSLSVLNSRSKRIYAAIVITVILSMVVTPLLQSAQVYAFNQQQAARKVESESQQKEQNAVQEIQADLHGDLWNPHSAPVTQSAAQVEGLTADDLSVAKFGLQAASAQSSDASDEDGDGLIGDDDPCPQDSDCDADGLTDAQEIRLGTDPQEKDTDGDYITDNAEVAGFWYNNQWWYSNPSNPDSNNDGLNDGTECANKAVDEDELSPDDVACEDLDGDGTPDIFDRDNDEDGVPDQVDLSPGGAVFQENGDPFDGQDPLQIQVDALQSDVPVFVDFQVRPANEDHIWYALNVLDWPSGDEEGQIMRKSGNDSTFADVTDPAANAANGDMRLIPMLEIEIPYKEGHYANLPVLEGAPPRTKDSDLDEWLDRQTLSDYGISVRPANDDGDLVAYVPLNLIEDETGGDRVAFGGRMFYWPTNTVDGSQTSDWGNTQQIRMVWLVQMLTDYVCSAQMEKDGDCNEGEWVTDTTQIVRGYDESWYLTGLSVREDHGLQVAIAYEDPAQEPSNENRQSDDWLWALAHGLDQSFLTGRDQDDDGQRDITVSEIHARFDNRVNSGVSDEARWGIPITATQVITFAYEHEDFFVHVMLTETQKILNDTFTAYKDQGADAPSLLFAQEAQYRAVNLVDSSQIAQDGNLLRIDVDPEAVQQYTRTFVSWAPYRYNADDDAWENYPIDEYMDLMEVRLQDSFDEYQDDPDYEDILRGQILLAQAQYLSFFAGVMRVVQVGDTLTGNYGPENYDVEMAKWINNVDIDKTGGVISRQTYTLANTIAKIAKYYKNIDLLYKDIGVISQGSFKATLKHLWQNASWKKLKLGASIAGAVIAAGALIAALALYGQGNGRAAILVLDSVITGVAVLDALYTARSIIKFLKASQVTGKWAKFKDVMKAKGVKYNAKAFAIGVVVAAVVILGVFLIAWGASGERWDSLAFTLGLASVLSSIITMVILMAIAAIPIVGQIIATVIFLLDVIFQIVCHVQDREDEDFFCQGISGYISQGVRWVIFSQNIMVKLDDDKFLQITDFEQKFQKLEAGMAQGNNLIATLDTRHQIQTLPANEMSGWMSFLYRWQYNDKNTKSTTVEPHLDSSAKDYHWNLDRGEISGDWSKDGNNFTYNKEVSAEIPLTASGINQPASLYLNDGYALPVQECWLLPNPLFFITPVIPVCYARTLRDSINVNLGKNLFYDVFPATFDEFMELATKDGGYALAWSQDSSPAFPRLKDADGDGLRNKLDAGADPNDLLWDSDGDRLSDYFEHESGSNPLDIDSDDDGLDDYQEVLLGTDPNRADSDFDGLTDKEEVDGWEFVYDFAEDGSQLSTWVTSDPLSIDGDGDTFSDFQEKTFGFHPGVKSDPSILTLESQVSESLAPHLLLRLDGLSSFDDESGFANNAACQGEHCPVAGHYGKYGNAPQFDGVDDYLEINRQETLLANDALTLSTWVYLTDPNADQKIVGKTSTQDGFVLGVSGGQLYPEVWDSQGTRFSGYWGSIQAETWTHLALTWQSGGQMTGYINGEIVGSTAASGNPIGGNNLPMRIGIAPWDAASWPVAGRIDEVIFFPRALTQAEIQAQAEGRYNPDDLTVQSGDELSYEATVTNELFNRYAQGLLSTHFPAAFSELPPQDFVLNPQEHALLSGTVTVASAASGVYTLTQETDALITDWREDSSYAEARYRFSDADSLLEDSSGSQPPRDGECQSPHCPSLAAGRYGNGAQFDGVDDYVSANAVAEALTGPALSFGGWVYPQSGMSNNGVMLSFHTASGSNLLMLEYDPSAEKFIAYDRDAGDNYSANSFAPGQWYHVEYVIYEGSSNNASLYVNGVEEAHFSAKARPDGDGRFSLGQEWDGDSASNFFAGRLDEIAVYPRALSEAEIQDLYNNPVFHLALDEGPGADSFEDDSGFENTATCQGDRCPQSGVAGISGNAIRLDGSQYLSTPDSSTLDLSSGDFTLSAWIYPQDDPPLSDCPFRAEYFSNTRLSPDDDTIRKCEDYPIKHDWGTGGPFTNQNWSQYTQYFSARWTGTFFFEAGTHTFNFTSDDGMRAWVDDVQILNEWHTQSETTYHVDHSLTAGKHTIKVEYFEQTGGASAKVSWTTGPLPHPQAIFGAENYPALQSLGDHLRLVLNENTAFLTSHAVLTLGDWNHVAASFDGSTWFLYVNGTEVDQFNVNGQVPESGQGFDIGRANTTAQLDLQSISVLDGSDNNTDGDVDLELRIQLKIDGDSWDPVWENDTARTEADYPVDIQRSFKDRAQVKVYESDENEYNFCLFGCQGEDHLDEQMGTTGIPAAGLSPYENSTRFESNKGDKADLLWYSQIDSIPFQGKIDEVAIYKAALTAEQVSDLYDAGTLVLRLALDDAPGASEFVDALGQHNGSCSGITCPTAGVPGREEMALLFDGLDDYASVNDVNTGDLENLTLAAWVRPDSTPAGIMRFITVGDEKAVLRYENGDLDFYIRTLGDPDPVIKHLRFAPGWQAGRWYHVAATYDGKAMRLYLDGAEVASQAAGSRLYGEANFLRLSHSTETLDGALDDVRLYRRALDASEIRALYEAAPEMLLQLDEEGLTSSFSDASGNGHTATCSGSSCPDAGAKGQIGLSALFDGGNDYLEVPDDARLNPVNEMTLSAWVKLEDTDPDQKLVGKSTTHDGYILGVQDGQLYPEIWDSSGSRFSGQWGQITAGYWTHVAFTWKSGGDLVAYINGQEVGRLAASADPIGDNGNPLRVGIAPWNGSSFPANGRIDQVTLYTRALTPLEMRAMFRLQAKWVEDRQYAEITIDNEPPISRLVSDETYRPNHDVMLLVQAGDSTTLVTQVEMGVSLDNGAGYSWQSVPACEDSREDTAWCPIFEPTIGEGRYLLQFRATDQAGNQEIPSQTYTVLVDDTPPQPNTAISEGQILRAELQPDNSWLLPLSGTVSDPQIAGSPGSGVVEVSIKLTDTDPVSDTLPLLSAQLNGGAWQVDYPLNEADATGSYILSVEASDQMGNRSELQELITLGVDTAPPQASLNDITAQTGVTGTITTTLQLSGLITETGMINAGLEGLRLSIIPTAQEAISATLGIYHFDEPAGATRFASETGLATATCENSSCPQAGHPGVWGSALDFDGNADLSLDGIPGAISEAHGFAFGAWVYPRDEIDGVMVFEDGSGGMRQQMRFSGGFLYEDPETGIVWGSPRTSNRWYHVLLSIDDHGRGTLYVDGQVDATFTTNTRPDPDGNFRLGYGWNGSSRDFLHGTLDELRIYDRALAPNEVDNLFDGANLDDSGQGVQSSAWDYTIPGGLDGLYQINLRPGDIYTNTAPQNEWPAWNGQIDTSAPQVDISIVEEREAYDLAGQNLFNVQTTYTCWAQDFNLLVASEDHPENNFECPCQSLAPASTVISNTFYHEVSPWYAQVFTDTVRLWEHTESCTVPGLAVDNFMQACDSFGHCASDVAEVDQLVDEIPSAYSVVITPTHQTILTSPASIIIEGKAYARDGIQQINVYDGAAFIGTVAVDLSCSGDITSTDWNRAWIPSEGSHNLRSNVVTCAGETVIGEGNQVELDTFAPLVGIFPTQLNRDQRLSWGRLQLSGPATDATSGLARVEVSVDGGEWAEASFDEDSWQWNWYLGEEPDNASYNVSVRASDRAGWSSQANASLTVDLDVPNPVTLTLTSDITAGGVVTSGLTLRETPTNLDLNWQASEPSSALSHYEVLWTVQSAGQTLKIPNVVPPSGPLTSPYTAGEAQRVTAQVSSVFLDGNTQVDDWGAVYIDTPLTPDYISMQEAGFSGPYRGWMESGCSNLGVDRRIQENAPDGISLSDPQNLFATWDSEALRLAWVGANWDYDGDLFIYLNDFSDPSVPLTAFNPFTETQQTQLSIPGARAFIWVQDAQFASLFLWNGSSFDTTLLTPGEYHFTPGLNGGTTDLYLPFDLLGIDEPALTPLSMFAFTTDEGQMRLWATQPAQNPVNSPNVVTTDLYAGVQQVLEWLHVYAWPSLGPGICPNAPTLFQVYTDADLHFDISTQPEGSAYGLQSSDLFWMADQLTALTRTVDLSQQFSFMDVDHLPVGNGDEINYTLSFSNRGTYTATGVTVRAIGLYALEFTGEADEAITIPIGDIPPNTSGSVTFSGQVDTVGPYNDCLTQTGGDTAACRPYRDWAVLNAVISDDAYSDSGNPLDWLWVDHQVDSEPPVFFGILQPESFIHPGVNTLSGYAFDESGVKALTLDVQPPSGGSYQVHCPDETASDGAWSCDWDAGAASDGQVFQIRLQAQDRYGNTSSWSVPYVFSVDGTPPVTSLSDATLAYGTKIIDQAAVRFSGSASDNYGLDWDEVCVDGECRVANSLVDRDAYHRYADDPSATLPIGACDGGELVRSFTVSDDFILGNVSLGLNIDHPQRDDLLVRLTSPSGTTLQVFEPPSGSASDYANLDVSLDDANFNGLHTSKGDDDTAEPYFDRQTRPAEPLDILRGESSAGTWTLTICDLNPGENQGSYNRSQLDLNPQTQAVTTAGWSYIQTGLEGQDYVEHLLEAYAYDLVGNRSSVASLNFWVDNVAPNLNVSKAVQLAATGFTPEPLRLLDGTISDGGTVEQIYALAVSPQGKRLSLQVGQQDGNWWLDLTPEETGEYRLWINASDEAGNAVSAGPFKVKIVRVLADNDGPTSLGSATLLSATVTSDDASSYSYDWDFGDGSTASGQPATVSHLYAAIGVYTASVTAWKDNVSFTATTTVTVDQAISGLLAINNSPAFYGDTTTLTATVDSGSNVEFAWDFGDGQPSAQADQAIAQHGYPAGSFTAIVTAMNSVSLITATTQVQMIDLIASSDSPTEVGQVTTFTAMAMGGDVSAYQWDFGDHSPLIDAQSAVISYTYPLPGIYTATVGVESSAGWITTTTPVTIFGVSLVSDSPTALGNTTSFTATTSLTGTINYAWDFGDSSPTISGAESSLSHTYLAAGIYTAFVTANNQNEQFSASSIVVVDGEPPEVAILDPLPGQTITTTTYTIGGTAADDSGLAWVEVSTDGGQTWQRATGKENWTFEWNIPAGDHASYSLVARAQDLPGQVSLSEPVTVNVDTRHTFCDYLSLIMR